MNEKRSAREFRSDPLGWIDRLVADGRPAGWIGPGRLLVGDGDAARAILTNADGLYPDHSDFFTTRWGVFGPRESQVEIGKAGRALIERHLRAFDADRAVAALASDTLWPACGAELVRDAVGPILARRDRSHGFCSVLDAIVTARILHRERGDRQPIRTLLRRRAFIAAFDRELARSDASRADSDLIDLLAGLARHAPVEQAMEVYMAFVFAAVSSAGFTLGWTLYLAATHGQQTRPAKHLICEALRLYPIAWLLDRTPIVAHDVAGEAVGPDTSVIVCPYAIHRNPLHWDEPAAFRPDRWTKGLSHPAWLPFGWGAHRCPGAGLTFDLVGRLLSALLARPGLRIEPLATKPSIGAALAPPRFRLLAAS